MFQVTSFIALILLEAATILQNRLPAFGHGQSRSLGRIRAMKLITWNIQWGRGIDGVDLGRIAPRCEMADFDVLCLQEVADNFQAWRAATADQFSKLAGLLPARIPAATPRSRSTLPSVPRPH